MEHTWLAYAIDGSEPVRDLQRSETRVAEHYQRDASYDLVRRGSTGPFTGMVIWAEADPACAWPLWSEGGSLDVATVHVPTGWERVVGDVPAGAASLPLARALIGDPASGAELNGPFILAARDREADTLTILNDAFGIAGLYTLRSSEGWVWSNRLGALHLFAGTRPRSDSRAWAIFAATGWFSGESTPIRGARRLLGGSVVSADARGARSRRIDGVAGLVRPREPRLSEAARAAREQIAAMVDAARELWPDPPRVDLSGGQDSRVAASAVAATEIDAVFTTENVYPGEPEVAARLIATAPRHLRHRLVDVRKRTATGSLRRRLAALHLAYDGVRWPVGIREGLLAPSSPARAAVFAGHGGETARGFYYSRKGDSERRLRYARKVAKRGHLDRLLRSARDKGGAGREENYDALREELERALEDGREAGLDGLPLFDYYYLRERFRNIQDLDTGVSRLSVFATPAFVRAAFDLSPEQRLDGVLHRDLVTGFLPAWQEIPFYKPEGGAGKVFTRARIWEGEDAVDMEQMLEQRSVWADMFRPDRIQAMWEQARAGMAPSNYEQVFERLAWRVSYEDHLLELGRPLQA